MSTIRERASAAGRNAIGAGQIAGTVLSAPITRKRYNRWGATDAEVTMRLPGDEIVPQPRMGYTRAISVAASPPAIWPWLVQIGQGRGGFYSYDGLENLARCDITSADHILAEHQHLAAGDIIRLGPQGYPCFQVWQVTPPTDLVLVGADPVPPHARATADDPTGVATWQFALRPAAADTGTRLLVRQRLTYPDRLSALWHVVEPVGFVMERQMMLGIKRRAERPPGA